MRLSTLDMFFDNTVMSGSSAVSTVLDIGKAGVTGYPADVLVAGDATGITTITLQGSDDGSVFSNIVTVNGKTTFKLPYGCPRYMRMTVAGASMSGHLTAGITLCTDSKPGKRIGNFAAN